MEVRWEELQMYFVSTLRINRILTGVSLTSRNDGSV